jgi:hypothetical protein
VVPLVVNAYPVTNDSDFNIPYASVTVCVHGTQTCATIPYVLVDTGSYGLRIFASALAAAHLTLPVMADPNNSGNTIAECVPFAQGYTWGPLASADVKMAGETASGVSVNILDDNDSYAAAAPSSCTSNGSSLNMVSDFSANGVLGVGTFVQDCGDSCAPPDCDSQESCAQQMDDYYSCNTGTGGNDQCSYAPMALSAQVSDPVALFASDNNGVILQLPSVPPNGAVSASGNLIFGIGTRSNNALGGALIVTADPDTGNFTTVFNGQPLDQSFIDSGSNALYFNDDSITQCSHSSFYCPSSTLSLSATNEGASGGSNVVQFQVSQAFNLPSNQANYAFSNAGGTASLINGSDGYFDWGLPFFYGQSVYVGFAGSSVDGTAGPFYAYAPYSP